MKNYKELIGNDCWDIILDYKTQLEHTDKYDKVMYELIKTYKYKKMKFYVTELRGKKELFLLSNLKYNTKDHWINCNYLRSYR